jgi:hypothetical protein
MYIPGLMDKPQSFYTNQLPRRGLHLIVAINLLGGTFMKESTGTAYGAYEGNTYLNKDGDATKKLTGAEYVDFVEEALTFFKQESQNFARNKSNLIVVHDHSPIHTCKLVAQKLEEKGIRCILSPTRSPDLDPLDYGIFGVKEKLNRADVRRAKWEDRVEQCMQAIQEVAIRDTILQLPLRLNACIHAKGGHFQRELLELKKDASHQMKCKRQA